jgi:hypothetical protein
VNIICIYREIVSLSFIWPYRKIKEGRLSSSYITAVTFLYCSLWNFALCGGACPHPLKWTFQTISQPLLYSVFDEHIVLWSVGQSEKTWSTFCPGMVGSTQFRVICLYCSMFFTHITLFMSLMLECQQCISVWQLVIFCTITI